MANQVMRFGAVVATGLGLLTMNGCTRSAPEEYGGAPPPNMAPRLAPPELAGGPPPPDMAPAPQDVQSSSLPPADGANLAEVGPPPPPPGYVPNPSFAPPPPASATSYASGSVVVVAMSPIPNPEDLTAAERRRVYGPGRDHRLSRRYAQREARASRSGQAPTRYAARRAPAAATSTPSYTPPRMVKPEPARQAAPVTPAAKVAAPVKPTPVAPVVAATPTTAQGKLGQLQTTVGGAVARGSTLTVAPEISQGKPGQVSLSLPANLMETLKAEAAKLGLTKPARKADVRATLSGPGYTVTPNGQQTAALKDGEAARFDWQVAPAADAKGPLKADVDAVLNGQGKPQTFSLASIQSAVAVATKEVEAKSGFKFKMPKLPKFNLPFFGKKDAGEASDAAGPPPAPATDVAEAPAVSSKGLLRDRTLPVIGRVSGRTQGAVGLALLAVIILSMVSKNMANNRRLAERRRRYRTYQPMGAEEAAAEI